MNHNLFPLNFPPFTTDNFRKIFCYIKIFKYNKYEYA